MHGYFEGWYYKQRAEEGTAALIPAMHRDGEGKATASVQVITDEGSRNLPISDWQYDRRGRRFQMGKSIFTPGGCRVDLEEGDVRVKGGLQFTELRPPRSDIMGPFRFVPFMQCRHSVFSMAHRVNGQLQVGDKTYHFRNAPGYMEGDRGSSFPSRYLWTQHSWRDGGVMMSVADIPMLGGGFTGCIGFLYAGGLERRFATYLGARVEMADNTYLRIRQGDDVLSVRLLEDRSHPLFAPVSGSMQRTIHESVACRVLYKLRENGREIFRLQADRASFESAWEELKGGKN